MKRREFLKLIGVGAAGALGGLLLAKPQPLSAAEVRVNLDRCVVEMAAKCREWYEREPLKVILPTGAWLSAGRPQILGGVPVEMHASCPPDSIFVLPVPWWEWSGHPQREMSPADPVLLEDMRLAFEMMAATAEQETTL